MAKGDPTTPCAWANSLVMMWGPRFPVDVRQIALEYSKRFNDPVLDIVEAPERQTTSERSQALFSTSGTAEHPPFRGGCNAKFVRPSSRR